MKLSILSLVLLAAFSAHAMDAAFSTSKKQVTEEIGPEKIILQARPSLATFLQTRVMDAQAASALEILSQDQANQGKSLEQMAYEALSNTTK